MTSTPITLMDSRPVALVFGATDSTGGGGIHASVEVLRSFGVHPTTAVTAVTVQNTSELQGYAPLDADIITEQATAILDGIPVSVILAGMLPTVEAVEALNSILLDHPEIPFVFSPSILSSEAAPLVESTVIDSVVALLFPISTALILNRETAFLLSPNADSLSASANYLLSHGVDYLLLTDSLEQSGKLTNFLYSSDGSIHRFQMERFSQTYIGAADTLAAAIGAGFAREDEVDSIFKNAITFNHGALRHAYRVGLGKFFPDRFFWAESPESAPE